ncbi:MAG: CHAT domain-containing protein [Leptolyngbyaceae cyanobacterium MO_188.B28]|nr:CHAT domain-containing protein [Leptolyngbyaceae cyanobacterium MO_188.B28]
MENSTPVTKILFLASNPTSACLRLDEEMREIDEGLKRSRYRERFEIYQRWAVRTRDIRRAMLEIMPQIVHFSGHGQGGENSNEKGLIFEDEAGQPRLVDGDALAGLFGLFSGRIEFVLLNSCYSKAQATAIAKQVPHVIGMQKAVGDQAAIGFAIGVYDALGAGRSVEDAFCFGCNGIQLMGISEYLPPTLVKRNAAGEVEIHEAKEFCSAHRSTQSELEKTPSLDGEVAVAPDLTSQSKSIDNGDLPCFSQKSHSIQPSQVLIYRGDNSGQIGQSLGNLTQRQSIGQGAATSSLTTSQILEIVAQVEILLMNSAMLNPAKQKALGFLEATKGEVESEQPDKSYAAKNLNRIVQKLRETKDIGSDGKPLEEDIVTLLGRLEPWLGGAFHLLGL